MPIRKLPSPLIVAFGPGPQAQPSEEETKVTDWGSKAGRPGSECISVVVVTGTFLDKVAEDEEEVTIIAEFC